MTRRVLWVPVAFAALALAGGGLAQPQRPPLGAPVLTSTAGFPHPHTFAAVPGPDARYLELVDTFDVSADGTVVHERASRLQINSFLAMHRRHGESFFEYDPTVEQVEVIVNRTALPSGDVVEAPANAVVDDLPAAVQGNPNWAHLRRKVVVHTALEPGAIIELRVRITRQPKAAPFFELRVPLAADAEVGERLVELRAPTASGVWLPNGFAPGEHGTEGDRTVVRWRGASLPLVSHPSAMDLAVAVVGADETAVRALLTSRMAAAGPLPDQAGRKVTEAAREPDAERRLRAILKVFSESLRTSRAASPRGLGWRITPLDVVWRSGWATPLELAALTAAGLRHGGIEAVPALLAAKPGAPRGLAGVERAVVAVAWPAVAGDGGTGCEIRLIDPVDLGSPTPLEARFSDADAVLLGDLACGWRQPLPARQELKAVLAVQPDGAFSGSLGLVFSGAATPHGALVEDASAFASAAASRLAKGTKVTSVAVTRLDRGAAALALTVNGALAKPDRLGLVRVELGAAVQQPQLDHLPLPPDGWPEAIELPGPIESVAELSIELPEGWAVATLPRACSAENLLGAVAVAARVDGRTVRIRRTLRLSSWRVEVGETSNLRALLVAWRSPASQLLWLRPPAVRATEPAAP
ncbi:MAG TPA: DUF3857 domain-containing protein [Thermoanaerobaculaceae bacterium]|nr:DUF3857 domain-containing protein [Thermoanaerobaculaceae bacterium]HRS15137.1 DUF3857 domain-containing protein [Thermoanaerobaculaceae bacterium]